MGDVCYFLHAQKVTKDAPGDSFDEHLDCAGVHRRRPPDPHFTGAGHFGHLISFGGLNFDCAFLSSRPTGAYCN